MSQQSNNNSLNRGNISNAANRLWLPRMSLMSCVRGALSRSTVGITLDEAQRYTHFPASPTCSLTWFFTGRSELIELGHAATQASPRTPLADVTFSGPLNHPFITCDTGPVDGMILILFPDALHALTGIDPGAYLNRLVPAHEVFDARWMEFCAAVLHAPDDASRFARVEAFLDPLWQKARPPAFPGSNLLEDWSNGLAMYAATSGIGRSVRQIDRRIKQWAGQPHRELRGIGRSERAFFEALAAIEQGNLNWTDIADNAGFSDQSHLCRQARRFTGFSPDELRRRIAEDESFWVYRLLLGFGEQT